MNKRAQLQFAHRCSVLLESGISLGEALSILLRIEKNKKRVRILTSLRNNVEKGISLSKSLVVARANFEPMLASMIFFGESSGILALSLKQASEIMEKGGEIKKKLIGALVYPAFIAGATIGMTLFLVMYIFPKIIPLFSTMDIELPLLTRVVRKLYELLLHFGFFGIGIVTLMLGVSWYYYRKNHTARKSVQMLVLILPVVGTMLQKYFICTYCRSTATLLDCGELLPKILEQLSFSSTFYPYKHAWNVSKAEVERGVALSQSLRSFDTIFPSLVSDMVGIGERTGSLASMFHHICRMYELELDDFAKQLSTSIEPILMIVMGLVVGAVALSIILPIYEITNHLSK